MTSVNRQLDFSPSTNGIVLAQTKNSADGRVELICQMHSTKKQPSTFFLSTLRAVIHSWYLASSLGLAFYRFDASFFFELPPLSIHLFYGSQFISSEDCTVMKCVIFEIRFLFGSPGDLDHWYHLFVSIS